MLDVGELIRKLQSAEITLELDVKYFEDLEAILHSNEIRDVDEERLNNLFSSLWSFQPSVLDQYIFEIELNSESNQEHFEKSTAHELKLAYFWDSIISLISLPELDVKCSTTLPQFTKQFMHSIFQLIVKLACTYDPPPQKLQVIKVIRTSKTGLKLSRSLVCFVHWIYRHRLDLRPFIRNLLCASLLTQGDNAGFRKDAGAGPIRAHVQPLLELLFPIISGLSPLNKSSTYFDLLDKVLIPLHQPNEFVEWRSQVPVIQDYHPALVNCMVALVHKSLSSFLPHVLKVILSFNENEFNPQKRNLLVQTVIPPIWPNKASANHIKELLLMEELETMLNLCTIPIFLSNAILQNMLLSLLCHSCGEGTEHIRIIQRALIMLKNSHILDLLFVESDKTISTSREVMRRLVSVLYRKGNKSWNPTVNKMTAQCLLKLKQLNEADFGFAAACLGDKSSSIKQQGSNISGVTSQKGALISSHRAASGGMAPAIPTSSAFPKPRPVASYSSTSASRAAWQALRDGDRATASNASMTVTGVAPWAMQLQQNTPVNIDTKPNQSHTCTTTAQLDKNVSKYASDIETNPMEILMQYIDDCKGKARSSSSSSQEANEMDIDEDESLAAAQKSWNVMQQSTSPVLLPNLRFLDLVWGHDLGEGAFSTVRYARVITKERLRIAWPEYAVKIISKIKICSENYLHNVEREIKILHLLIHPSVSRLVSAFRYKESYYMVLEYCPGGDLHSYIMQNGALSELYTRFIIMEIAVALSYIHNLGFIYFDLKPENVLITATGHVKLTDFGGTRPYLQQARDLLTKSRGILNSLRNGDWKEEDISNALTCAIGPSEHKADIACETDMDDDNRLEGTPGYMAPEALLLSASSYSQSSLSSRSAAAAAASDTVISTKADAWSLGCLVHFCVYGGPIYFGDRDDVLVAIFGADGSIGNESTQKTFTNDVTTRRVRFKSSSYDRSDSRSGHLSFQTALLETSVEARMSVSQAIHHWYLIAGASDGDSDTDCQQIRLNPDTIHTSPSPAPLLFSDKTQARGAAAGDADWQRRQLSMLIAPMPDSRDYSHIAATGAGKSVYTSGLPVYALSDIEDSGQDILSTGFV